jgi:hypothetical protein
MQPTQLDYIPIYLIGRALKLWGSGMDTLDISVEMELPEWAVYNSLSRFRDRLSGG